MIKFLLPLSLVLLFSCKGRLCHGQKIIIPYFKKEGFNKKIEVSDCDTLYFIPIGINDTILPKLVSTGGCVTNFTDKAVRERGSSSLRPYYYRWSYYDNKNGDSGWGENTICLNHKPTKREVIARIKNMFDVGRRKRILSLLRVDLIIEDDNYPFNCQPIQPHKF